jgi:hypothetical protein
MMQIHASLQRGEVVDVNRYLTSALTSLLDGTWDLPTVPSQPHKAAQAEPSADLQQWLQLAIARGLIAPVADAAAEWVYPVCDPEVAYPTRGLMEMLPLAAIAQSEEPISRQAVCEFINRLRRERNWPLISAAV